MKTVYRILALTVALAMLLGILPLTAAQDRTYPEIGLFNADFEGGDPSYWELSGLPAYPVRSNSYNTANPRYTLNLWASNDQAVEIHACYSIELTPGTYYYTFDISGQGVDSGLRWSVWAGSTLLAQAADTVTTVDWNVWNTIQTDNFTLTENTEVTFDFGGTGPVGYWVH